jgi:cardiolipin synthase
VTPLVNEAAYTAMLQAIDEAARSITMTTYIFDNDRAGQMFLEALARAVGRQVEVRVIVDDVGARYTWPSIVRPLRRAGIPVSRFLPKLMPWAFPYANLRNHRKILVIDGRLGFTGGMNIREGHCPEWKPRHAIDDLHFFVEGPVVTQLQEVFVHDWAFCTGELLAGEVWFGPTEKVGAAFARGISDGPDDDFEKLRTTILGALACAESTVQIVTPYFLPDSGLITALNITALRGVQVDILLPQKGNLRLVQWASTAQLWQILERGCRVWLSPPPFDHTKLMIVDGLWTLLGSANWDPRSLRLNFEFNLECYDQNLAQDLGELIQQKLKRCQPLTLADVDGRSLPIKLRDGVARLFSPYL